MKKLELEEESFNKLYKKFSNKDGSKIKVSQAKASLKKITKQFKITFEESNLDLIINEILSGENTDELNKEQYQVNLFFYEKKKIMIKKKKNFFKYSKKKKGFLFQKHLEQN